MTIQAVIFDWAGTTVDYGSRAPIVAFQQAFANVGIEITEAEIRKDMGLDKYTHIHKIINLPAVQNDWQARFQVLPTSDYTERGFADSFSPFQHEKQCELVIRTNEPGEQIPCEGNLRGMSTHH